MTQAGSIRELCTLFVCFSGLDLDQDFLMNKEISLIAKYEY